MSATRTCTPVAADCFFERALWRAGYRRVAGVDEVGRGPLGVMRG